MNGEELREMIRPFRKYWSRKMAYEPEAYNAFIDQGAYICGKMYQRYLRPEHYDGAMRITEPHITDIDYYYGIGFNAFLLGHRDGLEHFNYSIDLQRAIRMILHDCAKYHIDPDRIVTIGESMGGL